MKNSKRTILLTLIVLSLSALITPNARAWRVTLPGGSRAETVVVDADGNVIAAGRAYYGGEMIKLSGTTGQLIWQFNASHNVTEHTVGAIALDSHGDIFALFGNQRSVTKISGLTGQVIWVGIIGGTSAGCQNNFFALAVDHEDNVVAAGTAGCLFSVAKLDGVTGNERWHYEHEGLAYAVAVDPFGDVAAAGLMNLNFGTVKLRGTDGSELWRKEINGTGSTTNIYGNEQANAVAMDKDGSVVAVGSTANGKDNPRDFTVVKYLADGSTDWIQIIDGFFRVTLTGNDASDDTANAVVIDKDGSVIAAGFVQESLDIPRRPEPEHFHVIKISRNGNVVWSKPAEDPSLQVPPDEPRYIRGRGFSLSVNAFGNVVAGGVHGERFTLVKFWGRTGGRAWRRQLTSGTYPSMNGQAIRVVMDAASDVIAAGETTEASGFSQFTVVKLNRKDGLDFGDPPPEPFPPPDPSLTPVIFIPGIAGSVLRNVNDNGELWPGLGTSHGDLSLDDQDMDNYRNPQVNASDIIRDAHATIPTVYGPQTIRFDFYKPLIDAFRRAGYVEDGAHPTLFVFPYDWRKSNAVNATLLRNKIIEIRERYSIDKINIVTHSMGGLLARRYLLDNPAPELHHVDKLITIAAPWLGAPKALNAIETGEFLDFPIAMPWTVKKLLEFFASGHELLPSKAYFDLGGPAYRPFQEEWDINQDAQNQRMPYDYDQLYSFINGESGDFNARLQRSKPYLANRQFHSKPWQDDWRGKGFGVSYYHLYGVKSEADTIGRVIAKRVVLCIPHTTLCFRKAFFDVMPIKGDKTVPILSATRLGATEDYNVENAILIKFRGGKEVDHVGLTKNQQVQAKVFELLKQPPLPNSNLLDRKAATDRKDLIEDSPSQEAYYVRVGGAVSATLKGEGGALTYPLGDVPSAGDSEVTSYLLGEDTFLSILPTDDFYTLTFVTGGSPLLIDLSKGTDVETVQAIRYLDLDLPANTKVQLEITPEGVDALRYDSDGDGTFDRLITPTVSVSGPAAQDTQPPAVAFNESAQPTATVVAINATDSGSGVHSLFYSLDGSSFQPYVSPLSLNPRQTPVIYAFAEDNVANRSSLFTYSLTQPSQSISGIVTDASGNRMSGVTITVTGSQKAMTTTDSNGSYFFGSLPAGGTYTVVSSKTNYAFTPSSQTFTNLTGNQTANFVVGDTIPPLLKLPANISVNANIPQGATVQFTVTATDNATQNPRIACTSQPGSLFPIGTTTVACTATDEAGNSANGTFKIVVKGSAEQINDLIILVRGLNLPNGTENSLSVKLQHALSELKAGHRGVACNDLMALTNEVQAQSGKKIGIAQANQMLTAANRIRTVIGC